MNKGMNILYEDDAMLVCEKDAGVPVQSRNIGRQDLEGMVRMYLMKRNGKRDNFIAAVHRLDQPVEGMVVFAKTKKAAADLTRQIQQHHWGKEYLAVTEGIFGQPVGCLTDYLRKDGRTNTSRVVDAADKEGKKAVLEYEVLETQKERQLIHVRLMSGRHHQIRVQLSHAGHPIVGDMRYNGNYVNQKNGAPVALAACRITLSHPVTGRQMTFVREPSGRYFAEFKETISAKYECQGRGSE